MASSAVPCKSSSGCHMSGHCDPAHCTKYSLFPSTKRWSNTFSSTHYLQWATTHPSRASKGNSDHILKGGVSNWTMQARNSTTCRTREKRLCNAQRKVMARGLWPATADFVRLRSLAGSVPHDSACIPCSKDSVVNDFIDLAIGLKIEVTTAHAPP
jgi:hypothetical protein